jgi:hypothetical protein
MARIRSLKIGFFHNESLCDLSPWHRLLFEGLWLIADREGRLEDRPRRIKAELFPYDELDVDVLLTDLAQRGFLLRYDAEGVPAIAIVNFLKHQCPNAKESASALDAPTSEQLQAKHRKDSVGHENSDGEWSSVLGNGLGKGNGSDAIASVPLPVVKTRAEDLMEAWNEITHPPIARCRQLTEKRKRHCQARLKECPIDEWRVVFARIQASSFCRGEAGGAWVASFDWVIGSPDVLVKVLEGKYDDRKRTVQVLKPAVGMASTVGRREMVPDDEPL